MGFDKACKVNGCAGTDEPCQPFGAVQVAAVRAPAQRGQTGMIRVCQNRGKPMAVLFVSGVNDPSKIEVTLDDKGRIGYLLDGNCSVLHRMDLGTREVAEVLIFGKRVRQTGLEFNRRPSLIFNQIADPDTHRGSLERCIELCESVDSPVINHPRSVMRSSRERVSAALQGIPGVTMPRTIRFQPRSPQEVVRRAMAEGFGFPFLVRIAGLHGGVSMVRVDRPDDHSAMHALPFDGRDFYLAEFIDFQSSDGLYRKTRVVVVDGVPLVRHLLINTDWMVHASSGDFMDRHPPLLEEARSVLADFDRSIRPRVEAATTAIAERLGLDFFGIDCHIDEAGQMIVFEANANMNVLYNRRAMYQPCLDVIKKHLLRLIDARGAGSGRKTG